MATEDTVRVLTLIIGSGGVGAAVKSYLDYRTRDRTAKVAEPKARAEGDSIQVKTAEDVVAFVRADMAEKNAEIGALRRRLVATEEVLRGAGLALPE